MRSVSELFNPLLSNNPIISPLALILFVLWIAFLTILPFHSYEWTLIIIAIGIIIPFGVFLYRFSIHSILPYSFKKDHPFRSFISKVLVVLIISILPILLLSILLTKGNDIGITLSFFNIPIQLFFTVPFAWMVFTTQREAKEEINLLKKELGQSHANFDFLRSQINPHFLFNALNTLYGTAIQENAERTSEGIEKLGDMMRFMLDENIKEKISLEREVEYLKNYINLQKLRTESSENVKIQTDIQEQTENIQIAPMLLIPFVENAFKHGVSFIQPCLIKITLKIAKNTLHFKVQNNKYPDRQNDPEENEGGIGLDNVRQRLELQYPDKYNLDIQETSTKFYAHLTINFQNESNSNR